MYNNNNTRNWALSTLFFLFVIFNFGCDNNNIKDTGDFVKVPKASVRPVLINGIFAENEWDDAMEIQIGDNNALYLKEKHGHVFLGVKIVPFQLHSIELYISPDEDRIYHFHASAQIGEKLIKSDSDWEDQQFRWGNSHGWYANEIRWDQFKRDSLLNSGVADNEAFTRSMYKFEGFEFQILESKFETNKWKIRVEIQGPPDYENPLIYPSDSERKNRDSWMELKLD